MLAETLGGIALFSRLSEQDLEDIAAQAVLRTFAKNTVVMVEGDPSSSLYVIVEGKIKIFVSDDGKAVIVNMLGDGDFFGELSLIDQRPRSASAATLTQSRMAIISREVLVDYVHSHPEVAFALLEGIGGRLRQTTEHAKRLALMDVYGRVRELLLREAEQHDEQLLTKPLTQQQIADHVGASREMVNRILKELRTGGYIGMEGKRILIQKTLPVHW